MDIDRYFSRLKFSLKVKPNYQTLAALHKAHMLHIPFENFDVHLGRRVTLNKNSIFEKLVGKRRGGWCYENNILFGELLEAIGFKISLVGILSLQMVRLFRERGEPDREMRHPVLRVELDEPFLADVGNGEGSLFPVPYPRMEETLIRPVTLAQLQADVDWFQYSPNSPHMKAAVCHRITETDIITLTDRTLKTSAATTRINSEAEYRSVLGNVFEIDIPETTLLWGKIIARETAFNERV